MDATLPRLDRRIAGRLGELLWMLLGFILVALFALAAVLLVKTELLSGGPLTDERIKALWAFLGVALGTVVTLIGTLLTDQHNRRTAVMAAEVAERERIAKERDQKLAEQTADQLEIDRQRQRDAAQETEDRLKLDTVAKVLDLITVDGSADYAPKARVAGSLATMMELGGGTVATRILGQLWTEDAIDPRTAVWLVDRILEDSKAKEPELEAAAAVLAENAHKLTPAENDPNQDWVQWPHACQEDWPDALPWHARNHLMNMTCKAMLVRRPEYWVSHVDYPFSTLNRAVGDPDYGSIAALVLKSLIDLKVIDPVEFWDESLADESVRILCDAAEGANPSIWFKEKILSRLPAWAANQPVPSLAEIPSSSVVASGQDAAGSSRALPRLDAPDAPEHPPR